MVKLCINNIFTLSIVSARSMDSFCDRYPRDKAVFSLSPGDTIRVTSSGPARLCLRTRPQFEADGERGSESDFPVVETTMTNKTCSSTNLSIARH